VTHYYEFRTLPNQPNTTLGAEIARHLAMRQDLGTTVVVSNAPVVLISVVRKTWLHLARQLQKQRAATLNPEEILRFTHTIMHMQRMQFVAKTPAQLSDAQVYFITPDQLDLLPSDCFTLYLCDNVDAKAVKTAVSTMPNQATVVNFDVGLALSPLGLRPKSELETKVLGEWQRMCQLLKRHNIQAAHLARQNPSQPQAIDDALDTLLGYAHEFLHQANGLRHSIHLAQPLNNISADQQQLFDVIMRLAHRVQALSPQGFNNYLVRTFGEEKESYFLRDRAWELTDSFYDDRKLAEVLEQCSRLLSSYVGAV